MTDDAPPEDGGTDWRRLAAERNVPLNVARALWERAWAAASGDPVQAEAAFLLLLDDAEAANITQEPGRGTLADSSAREAFSLGPGKWTRVLIEQAKPARQAPRAPQSGKPPTADQLRNEILAAEKAAKDAAALLAASDPATIIQVLHDVSRGESSPVLQKVVGMAGGLISRIIGQRAKASPAPTSASAEGATADAAVAEGATAERATVEGASAEGTSAEGTSAEGTPAEGTSAEGTPAEGTPAEGTPAEGTPAEGTPAEGTPAEGASAETSAAGTSAEGTSVEGPAPEGARAGEPASPGSSDTARGSPAGGSVPADSER